MAYRIAVATADDIACMSQWAADEGWNPGNTDWLAFAATDPAGFLVGRLDGEPVTCISVVRYGTGFGFLGFYIARPQVRGRGHGLEIWHAGMARLAGRNVGLDGVVAQQGNYRKSGFRRAWNNVRHEGPPPSGVTAPPGVVLVDGRRIGFDTLAAYDRRFFPEPRDAFLSSWVALPERRSLVALRDGALAGFGVMRACRAASRIGPLYADSPEVAATLVSGLASAMSATAIAIDVPDVNARAVALARHMGLAPSFETARMYTGPDPAVDVGDIFGVTSLELG